MQIIIKYKIHTACYDFQTQTLSILGKTTNFSPSSSHLCTVVLCLTNMITHTWTETVIIQISVIVEYYVIKIVTYYNRFLTGCWGIAFTADSIANYLHTTGSHLWCILTVLRWKLDVPAKSLERDGASYTHDVSSHNATIWSCSENLY